MNSIYPNIIPTINLNKFKVKCKTNIIDRYEGHYKIGETYECFIYTDIDDTKIFGVFFNEHTHYQFKVNEFHENFATIQDYRNEKIKKILCQ